MSSVEKNPEWPNPLDFLLIDPGGFMLHKITEHPHLPDFLPGRLVLGRGTPGDYRELEQFHYVRRRPATWADVWTIRYFENRNANRNERDRSSSRIVAIGVLSYPAPHCRARDRRLSLLELSPSQKLVWINQHLRTISRVVVHPQFRSLGLSTVLVRWLCDNCPTRYVDALAMMGRAHPLFERAGMTRIEPQEEDAPIYFILDRFNLAHEQEKTP
jgi:GNAT superfamily N-acetyltransferase